MMACNDTKEDDDDYVEMKTKWTKTATENHWSKKEIHQETL